MPRARSPNRDKAFTLWIDSGGKRELKDIAAELGVSAEQVRKWKCADKWDAKTQKVTLPNGKGHVTKRKRGGQPGNKNAVGNSGGAPLGSANHYKHGLYMKVYMDTLTEEERELLDLIPEDEEELLEEQIGLLTIRERRLMKTVAEYKAKNLIVESIDQQNSETDTRIKKFSQKYKSKTVHTTAAISVVERAEAELTRVQGKKTKAIEALARLRAERKKQAEGGDKSALADDWIGAMMEVDGIDQE